MKTRTPKTHVALPVDTKTAKNLKKAAEAVSELANATVRVSDRPKRK
jgi:hypothetical protein